MNFGTEHGTLLSFKGFLIDSTISLYRRFSFILGVLSMTVFEQTSACTIRRTSSLLVSIELLIKH